MKDVTVNISHTAFARSADRRSYEFHRQEAHRREEQRRKEKSDRAERAEDDLVDFATAGVLATDQQIIDFTAELDTYDEATVRALMENDEQMAAVEADIQRTLEEAYLLPDGRRVFKTEDGLRVFDADGREVFSDTIDPEDISPNHPSWEVYKGFVDRGVELRTERDGILKFQEQLDDSRVRLDDEDLTVEEIDDMRERLGTLMPDAVKRQMPGYEEPQVPDLQSGFAQAARLPMVEPVRIVSTELTR